MTIDWFTVVAEAVNFLILAWLLKRFLYRPVLAAIDAREKRIATELAGAAAKMAEAQKERDEFQHKNQEFDQQRAALLSKATGEAQAERQRLLDDAQKAAVAVRTEREDALQIEQRNLSHEIIRWTQNEVFAIARKALAALATASLEESMCEVFVQRLRGLTGTPKDQLATALKAATRPVPVRSAFDLPPAQQTTIQTALNETFSADIPIQFETVPELVGGIELSASGQKVAWSIGDYLGTLEQNAGALLRTEEKAEEKPEAKSESKPEAQTGPKAATPTGVKSQPTKPAPKSDPKLEAEPNPKS
ncbi:F0F1 ATP synthase subunit B [Fimbriiglobus ruber]|uniref:ATP synthase subunit b n=1 Tax=Fimbriiglobus ruber TaxID=1908690 RepID=A0A225DUD3_9BACT|nr:F0F1 ATP synthase subunit B [Fimbriiglobus ruber]OWK39777.1 ATP synthase F0 sector subunit b [Fimbriiglobus ruber]